MAEQAYYRYYEGLTGTTLSMSVMRGRSFISMMLIRLQSASSLTLALLSAKHDKTFAYIDIRASALYKVFVIFAPRINLLTRYYKRIC